MINYIINIQVVLGGRDIYKTKCGSETDQFIFILSHSGLKTTKFVPSSANWAKMGAGAGSQSRRVLVNYIIFVIFLTENG